MSPDLIYLVYYQLLADEEAAVIYCRLADFDRDRNDGKDENRGQQVALHFARRSQSLAATAEGVREANTHHTQHTPHVVDINKAGREYPMNKFCISV